MARIYEEISGSIANIPLVRLNHMMEGLPASGVAKVEPFKPIESEEDRIGVSMIEAAEQAGLIGLIVGRGHDRLQPDVPHPGHPHVKDVRGYSRVPPSFQRER